MGELQQQGVKWPNVLLAHSFDASARVSVADPGKAGYVGRIELDSPMDFREVLNILVAMLDANPAEAVGSLWMQTRLRRALESHAAFVFLGVRDLKKDVPADSGGDSLPLPSRRLEILNDYGAAPAARTTVRFVHDFAVPLSLDEFRTDDDTIDYGRFFGAFKQYVQNEFDEASAEMQTVGSFLIDT